MTFRPMPILTALSVVSLVILVLLGNWQYARYSEKIDAPPIEEQVEERVLLRVLIDNANPGFAQQVYGFANLGLSGFPKIVEPVQMTVRSAAETTRARQTLNPYAFAKPIDPLPPERHFGYALTWWGMALGLIGVYVALHRARGRLKF